MFLLYLGAVYKLTVRLVSPPGAVLALGNLAGVSTSVAGYASMFFPGYEPVVLAICAAESGFGTSLLLMRFGFLCTHVGLRSSLANASGAAFLLILLEYEPSLRAILQMGHRWSSAELRITSSTSSSQLPW